MDGRDESFPTKDELEPVNPKQEREDLKNDAKEQVNTDDANNEGNQGDIRGVKASVRDSNMDYNAVTRFVAMKIFGLRKVADLKTLLWMFTYFASFVYMWVAHDRNSYIVRACGMVISAYFSFANAVIAHNSMHCAVFKSPVTTRVFQMFLSLTYGHPVSTFVPGHNLSHHKYTEHLQDPMRTSKLRWKSNFMNFLMFQPTVAGAVLKQDIRYFRLIRTRRPEIFTNCMCELFLVFAVQFSLLYLDWRKFMLYWQVCHFFGQYGIVTMNHLQHDGCDTAPPGDKINHNTSRNFVGPVINFFAFNNGYHAIHHLYPTLHWSETAEAHDRLIKPNNHPNLNCQCMFRYIWSAIISPGMRVTYLGEPHKFEFEEEPEDEDWMAEAGFYPSGKTALDYDLSLAIILKALSWHAFGSPLRAAYNLLAPEHLKVA